jgi:putative transposase
VKRVAEALGLARSNLAAQMTAAGPRRRRGRRPQQEAELFVEIKQIIAGLPSYGYRRLHALSGAGTANRPVRPSTPSGSTE